MLAYRWFYRLIARNKKAERFNQRSAFFMHDYAVLTALTR